MTYTPTNWVDGSTPLNRANMMRIENELALLDGYTAPVPPPTLSATPPGSPVDGQLWVLPADAANGVNWQFRYNAGAGTYKWEFIGGSPMRSQWLADIDVAMTATVTALPSLPTVTIPRTGEYQVAHAAYVQCRGTFPGAYDIYLISYDNAVGTEIAHTQLTPAAQYNGASVTQTRVNYPLIGGHVVGLAASSTVSITNRVGWPWFTIMPIRVA